MANKETFEVPNDESQAASEENEADEEKLSENSFDSSYEESRRPSDGNVLFLHVQSILNM